MDNLVIEMKFLDLRELCPESTATVSDDTVKSIMKAPRIRGLKKKIDLKDKFEKITFERKEVLSGQCLKCSKKNNL